MHLRGTGGKPFAAACCEMRRFWELDEAKDVCVKRSRIGFAAARHCKLHVMNHGNHELIILQYATCVTGAIRWHLSARHASEHGML